MSDLNIGDEALYKDIGGKKNIIFKVTGITKDKKGKVTAYAGITDKGASFGCAADEATKLKR